MTRGNVIYFLQFVQWMNDTMISRIDRNSGIYKMKKIIYNRENPEIVDIGYVQYGSEVKQENSRSPSQESGGRRST